MVPWPNAGFLRRVYPGFIQLSGFMTMNLDRHRKAHWNLFENLVKGDCNSVAQHRKFYDDLRKKNFKKEEEMYKRDGLEITPRDKIRWELEWFTSNPRGLIPSYNF